MTSNLDANEQLLCLGGWEEFSEVKNERSFHSEPSKTGTVDGEVSWRNFSNDDWTLVLVQCTDKIDLQLETVAVHVQFQSGQRHKRMAEEQDAKKHPQFVRVSVCVGMLDKRHQKKNTKATE